MTAMMISYKSLVLVLSTNSVCSAIEMGPIPD